MNVPNRNVLIVGISGATCSGKTTIARELHETFKNSILFSQDNYYLPVDDPRHVFLHELNHINWDIVTSLDMDRMTKDVLACAEEHASSIGKNNRNGIKSPYIIIVEGFYYDECFKRRIKRVYEPPDVPGYFEKCVWPEHLKQLEEVKRDVDNIVYFQKNSSNEMERILSDIRKW
ncbi:hypothetical protein ABEB36_001189 [Hypothenemus hampei]|uniref:Nicotinamide riboside kinase 1 n=1 Tax=Hypothenemus hampei TaxID=57062 RepID=A0ABD1FDS5_HYPHA